MAKREQFRNLEQYAKRTAISLSAFALLSCGVDTHSTVHAAPESVESSVVLPPTEEVVPPTVDLEILKNQWDVVLASQTGEVNVALMDLQSDQMLQTGNSAPGERFYTASSMKLSILVEMLRQYEAQGIPVEICEDELNSWQEQCQSLEAAYPMITVSDNSTASQLFQQVGGAAGMQQFFDSIGAVDTTASSSWGLTLTTAADQLKVMRAAIVPGVLLSQQYVDVARRLLQQVDASQKWGATSGLESSDVHIENKNGWLPEEEGTYNTVGHVYSENGRIDYIIAILAQNAGGELATKATMEQLSARAYELIASTSYK